MRYPTITTNPQAFQLNPISKSHETVLFQLLSATETTINQANCSKGFNQWKCLIVLFDKLNLIRCRQLGNANRVRCLYINGDCVACAHSAQHGEQTEEAENLYISIAKFPE